MSMLLFCLAFTTCAVAQLFPRTIVEDFLEKRFASIEFTSIEKSSYNVIVFGENNKYFCTGTLITLEWIISAAHCMYSKAGNRTEDDRSVIVVAGANSLKEISKFLKNSNNSTPSSSSNADPPKSLIQTRRSVQVEVCNWFKFNIPFMHDLVLIRVPAFDQTPYTKPIALPTTALTTEENELFNCDSPGYGKILLFKDSKHDYKMKVQNYDLSKMCACFDQFEPQGLLYQNTWFCPITMVNTGLCDGDNGAPLVCDGLLRGVSTTIFVYENAMLCQKWPKGEGGLHKNDCGNTNNLNLFTDLCVYGRWINTFVSVYPIIDPATCVLKFPWTEAGVDLFYPKTRVNPFH